jgi:hypothetical protein
MFEELRCSSDWRNQASLPTPGHSLDQAEVYPDRSSGVHAHIQGFLIANEVLRVKDFLSAHFIFGRAGQKSESVASTGVETYTPSPTDVLVMEHRDVVRTLYDLVPQIERVSTVFRRIKTDPPFARQILCGVVSTNHLSGHEQDRLHDFIDRLSSLAIRYQAFAPNHDLFGMSGAEHKRDEDFRKLRKEHRRLFIEIAAFFEAGNWFSPSQFSSLEPCKGAHQPAVRFGSDYGRSYPELLRILESRFSEERNLPRGRSSLSLTGSGLQALNTALGVVERIATDQPPRPVVAQSGIYWECDERVRGLISSKWVSEVDSEPTGSAQQLVNRILDKKPRLVVAAPVGNSPDMPVIDVPELLSTLSSEEFAHRWEQLYPGELVVLLDNTVLSGAARWTNFDFSRLPKWCFVGSIESMIKLRQDGFDSAPSGSLTWYGNERVVEWLKNETASVRARAGFTPPPSTLFKLMLAPTHEYTVFRTEQHLLNSRILAAVLERVIGGGNCSPEGLPPIYLELVTPRKGRDSRPVSSCHFDDRDSPIFFIKVSDSCLEGWRQYFAQMSEEVIEPADIQEKILSLFISSVLDEARASGYNIHEGTSFGFDETRISRIESAIRVAPGIEHIAKVLGLKNLFQTSVALLGHRLQNTDLFNSKKERTMRFPQGTPTCE